MQIENAFNEIAQIVGVYVLVMINICVKQSATIRDCLNTL